jgi:hypothetical protein
MDDLFTQQEMAHLIRVSWIVLIPAGVLLSLVLYKLVMLLHGLLEFITLARYELTPAMKDLRLTAEHVEVLSAKAVEGVKTVEHSVASTGPALKSAGRDVVVGVESFWSGLKQSFSRKR